MSCSLSQEIIARTIEFHGHFCPGLAIGIRAAELARRELGQDAEMVIVTETDMCGVDALQFLTDCTFGRGNLIHRDWGKMAFSFYDRKTGKGVRARLNPDLKNATADTELTRRLVAGTATAEDQQRNQELRRTVREAYMAAELDEMFILSPAPDPLPRPPRILETLDCEACGETVMESRLRRFAGRTLCIPCFNGIEQKQ